MTELDFPGQLREFLPSELHNDAALTTRPALQLRPAGEGDTVIGHFGGGPEVPNGFVWPADKHHHFEHVATVDLAALPVLDLNLPDSGRFLIFGDTEGWEGVLHYIPGDVPVAVAALPPELVASGRVFERTPMSCTMFSSVPPVSWLTENLLDEDGDEEHVDKVYERLEAFGDLESTRRHPWHQIGGWANEIQGSNDCGILPGSAAQRRFHPDEPPHGRILLAQFDTDNAIGMGWGDFGMLYCFIDPHALSAHDFSDVQVYWECY